MRAPCEWPIEVIGVHHYVCHILLRILLWISPYIRRREAVFSLLAFVVGLKTILLFFSHPPCFPLEAIAACRNSGIPSPLLEQFHWEFASTDFCNFAFHKYDVNGRLGGQNMSECVTSSLFPRKPSSIKAISANYYTINKADTD